MKLMFDKLISIIAIYRDGIANMYKKKEEDRMEE